MSSSRWCKGGASRECFNNYIVTDFARPPQLKDLKDDDIQLLMRRGCPMSIDNFRALVERAHKLQLSSIWPTSSAIPDAVVDHHSEKGTNCHSKEDQWQFSQLVWWFHRPACEVVAEGAKRMMLCGFNMDNTTHDAHIVDVFKSIPA